jgi:hypothetical protein
MSRKVFLIPLIVIMAVGVVLALVLVQGEDSDGDDADIEIGTTNGDLPSPEADHDAQVTAVNLDDDGIEVSDVISSDTDTFRLLNRGVKEHGFGIEGNGIDTTYGEPIEPGDKAVFQLDDVLQTGTYTVFDPTGNTDARVQIVVQ